ncbi:MAG: molybdate ABC transporter substrate-binding protein [Rhodoblastus sp.]|nr:molybdate ABC transporter substrate-binding protein [Rhodoblastus sp.]
MPAARAVATDLGTTHVAVAANFTLPAKEIAAIFRQETGYEAVLSFGASGQFFAQIGQDAPFEVFLSADDRRPKDAAAAGLAVPESRFTYAIGQLVLWSKSLDLTKGDEALKANGFAKLAIANPAAAPYGAAALETLKALDLYSDVQLKIVQGNSIAQAFQFVETGNAELGFVARSQLANVPGGSRWLVPQSLYKPIRQDAVLLKKGADSAPSKAFLEFLRGPEARAIIERFGYALDR